MGERPNLSHLPSVDRVLRAAQTDAVIARHGLKAATDGIRAVLDDIRRNGGTLHEPGAIAEAAMLRLERDAVSSLRPVFNLTGTILHTNLGRAQLAEEAVEAAVSAMREAVALEYDLAGGRRGERDDHLRGLVCELTGAEDATLVNNNAAAVLLTLNALAQGRGVVVSRGELIEIGGAFRMPDIMARAGARLMEVGTTNRTHRRDYEEALRQEGVGMMLKVHTSNYRVEGFTSSVSAAELAPLARAAGVPLVEDLGSGTLINLSPYGLRDELTVRDAVEAGVDLVTFSGDKLLGGPQAGFIVGRRDAVAAINRNPMKRALRVDKLRLAALEATLKLYRDPARLAERLPTLRLMARNRAEIAAMATALVDDVARLLPDVEVVVVAVESQVGSGAMPLDTLPSAGLSLRPRGCSSAVERLADAFRALPKPVIGRLRDGALILDLRCLEDREAFLSNLSHIEGGEA
ncbi:L-seryl-tRNA(Sec) selenium transferase [Aureimonas altamirensis]|uniref:L-seryl-tRNA(Sec) selenium transferase n=1 Tax=Aureimonas altamirensis TaxID=370622 RepID=UPI0020369342|nr:L-seryl-tRNA(Sec) selenium transferase [Aureimonas altamirensis]MCM2504936.1 L-seryl-tRNA(Sec) selenium transferase [Aureimonas altamirensis]